MEALDTTNIPVEEMSISDLIDRSLYLRDEASALERQKKALDEERKDIDRQINALMEAQGLDRTGNANANVTRSKKRLATACDWDAFNEYVLEKGATYLFQRRLSQKALEEEMSLLPEGETLPGISIYEESSISLRRR